MRASPITLHYPHNILISHQLSTRQPLFTIPLLPYNTTYTIPYFSHPVYRSTNTSNATMSNNDVSAPQKRQRFSKTGYRPSREESGKIHIEWFAASHPKGRARRSVDGCVLKTRVQMMKTSHWRAHDIVIGTAKADCPPYNSRDCEYPESAAFAAV